MAIPLSALEIASRLIRFPSVSRVSNLEITDWIQDLLERLGFASERVEYLDSSGVSKANVIGRRGPNHGARSLALFAHTDVVPADRWTGPGGDPFEPVVERDRLYGRGACDMKGPLAAMLAAALRVDPADQQAPLWIVCTADEEVGFIGAKRLVADSCLYRQLVAESPLGIIGEPTRLEIVHAHKGVCGFRITSRGRAGHSSTREGHSANLAMIPMLQELKAIYDETECDPAWQDNRFDPPTLSWNIHMADDGSALNVTAARAVATVMFRPMPGVDSERLVRRVQTAAERLGLEFHSIADGRPLWVDPRRAAVSELMRIAGCTTSKTVCFSTDGGQFTELPDLAVIGPGDIAQGHTDDEWISLEQLQQGTELYERAIRHWCCGRGGPKPRE